MYFEWKNDFTIVLGWWIDGYKQLADNNESSFHIEKYSSWQRFWILSKKELECNAYTVFPWFLPEFSRMRPYSHSHVRHVMYVSALCTKI